MQLTAIHHLGLFLTVIILDELSVSGTNQQNPLRGNLGSRTRLEKKNPRVRSSGVEKRSTNDQKTNAERVRQKQIPSRSGDRAKLRQHIRVALVTKPGATVTSIPNGPTVLLHRTSIPPPVAGGPPVLTTRIVRTSSIRPTTSTIATTGGTSSTASTSSTSAASTSSTSVSSSTSSASTSRGTTTAGPLCAEGSGTASGGASCHGYPTTPEFCCASPFTCYKGIYMGMTYYYCDILTR